MMHGQITEVDNRSKHSSGISLLKSTFLFMKVIDKLIFKNIINCDSEQCLRKENEHSQKYG